ncbi:MAG: hypothetical protein D6E12_07790 [Desulfovibrio sp.]|nr:MAG: hypothetical protein D6E12_07790 [Desulfovibrio sp.]
MAQFTGFAANVQVNGQTVLAVVDGMGSFRETALAILEANGISDPQPGQWYSQQEWLDAFQEIADRVGANTLNLIGRKIPDNADFPADINTLEKALASIDVAYHLNHRGGDIGEYGFILDRDGQGATMACRNPYPCDFDLGIIQSMCQRFRGDRVVTIAHDNEQGCRKNGGDTCLYRVTWT